MRNTLHGPASDLYLGYGDFIHLIQIGRFSMSFEMSKAEREQFLTDVHVGVLGIAVPDRGPMLVPIWYRYVQGGEIQFMTFARSKKVEYLKSEGRCTICVQNEESPYQYVSVEGFILGMDEADLERDVRPICRRYLGKEEGDAYVEEIVGEQELLVRMRPERWSTADYGKDAD